MPKSPTIEAPPTRKMPLRKRPVENAERVRMSSQDSHKSYLDQLDSIPLSSVRYAPFDRSDADENNKKRSIRDHALFSELGISAPVPSKRFKHLARPSLSPERDTQRQLAPSFDDTALLLNSPSSTSPSPSPAYQPIAPATTQPTVTSRPTPKPSASSTRTPARSAGHLAPSGEFRKGPEYAYPRESLQTPLTQDKPIDISVELDEKSMEKEYWRRQRRVFVRSRFITMDEAACIANGIYRHQHIEPNHRMVVTLQANIANFRSKWRKILKEVAPTLGITKEDLTDLALCEERIRDMLDRSMLDWIWGHWIANPFVDCQAFYSNDEAVNTLTMVTAKALLVTLRHDNNQMKQRGFRKELDDLDQYTRTIYLPDPKQ